MLENPTHEFRAKHKSCEKCRPGCPPAGPQGGQAIAEFAFAFPLQLLIMFAIIQLSMMYVGKQVVTYASYSAARTAMVADAAEKDPVESAQRAAALICSPITGPTIRGAGISQTIVNSAQMELPGWGVLPNSGISRGLKTIVSDYSRRSGEIELTVTHYYELTFPLVSHIFAWMHRSPIEDVDTVAGPQGTESTTDERNHEIQMGIWDINAPHIRLRETTRLSVPGE
ncbi:MAG: TadE/TadG family type IV pilus assembly protein [Planctomycetota bacterium]